ncbi:MAG: replication-associated recombination protein A [bacterium]
MDLIDYGSQRALTTKAPLARRMRPRTLAEFVGQEHILAPGKLLFRAIEADRLTSLIFYGPPGTGKTALARIIAGTTRADFQQLNAVMAGIADIRKVITLAQENLAFRKQRTILFIDEIHRFNKAQQDALLPYVEEGTVIFIGATTENPMFEVIAPLLSRSRLFSFHPLSEEHVCTILQRALADRERGLGKLKIAIEPEALSHIARTANGDARAALNALELAAITTSPAADATIHITKEIAAECSQQRVLLYDKGGDNHFDTVSAFIKSLRGSDPDAALYWLARMLYAGEDPKFIVRRLLVHAAEDVGLADPRALQIAQAAAYAVDFVGMPEARLPLAEATLYIATAPKSNSVIKAIDKAMATVKETAGKQVPAHLRDSHYKGASALGHGKGYKYPHDYPGGYVGQEYLPAGIPGNFYSPTGYGYEGVIKERLEEWKEQARKNSDNQ